MDTKHTPGPWRHSTTSNFGNIVEGPTPRRLYERDDGYRSICTVQSCLASNATAAEEDANQAANIRLICAAPDLLEALEDAAFSFGSLGALFEPGHPARDEMQRAKDRVRAAIAKATGVA